MINQVTLVGRLTRNPELKFTPEGTPVANVTLALNRGFRNSNGQVDADFVQCTLWRKAAENTVQFCKKGSILGIVGRLQTRNYENAEGRKVYVTEVIADNVRFLGGKPGDDKELTSHFHHEVHPGESNGHPSNVHPDNRGTTSRAYPGDIRGTTSNVYPGDNRGTTSSVYPGDNRGTTSSVYPGDNRGTTSHDYPGENNGATSHIHPGDNRSTLSNAHPGGNTGQPSNVQPSDNRGLASHVHTSDDKVPASNVHPGDVNGHTTQIHPAEIRPQEDATANKVVETCNP